MNSPSRLLAGLSLCLVGAASYAQWKDVPPDLQEFYIYKGKCTELVFGDKDLTASCGPAVILSKFDSGRTSLLFQVIKGGLVAFYGAEQPPAPNGREFIIDKLAENTDPTVAATGKCSIVYSEGEAKTVSFQCSVQSGGKQYSASLQSEAKPNGFRK